MLAVGCSSCPTPKQDRKRLSCLLLLLRSGCSTPPRPLRNRGRIRGAKNENHAPISIVPGVPCVNEHALRTSGSMTCATALPASARARASDCPLLATCSAIHSRAQRNVTPMWPSILHGARQISLLVKLKERWAESKPARSLPACRPLNAFTSELWPRGWIRPSRGT